MSSTARLRRYRGLAVRRHSLRHPQGRAADKRLATGTSRGLLFPLARRGLSVQRSVCCTADWLDCSGGGGGFLRAAMASNLRGGGRWASDGGGA